MARIMHLAYRIIGANIESLKDLTHANRQRFYTQVNPPKHQPSPPQIPHRRRIQHTGQNPQTLNLQRFYTQVKTRKSENFRPAPNPEP